MSQSFSRLRTNSLKLQLCHKKEIKRSIIFRMFFDILLNQKKCYNQKERERKEEKYSYRLNKD